MPTTAIRKRTEKILTRDQTKALTHLENAPPGTFLLHGITGSGKTRLYIELAKIEQKRGRSSIILVPEIALTPQLVAEFTHHFKHIIVTHSGMSEAQRHQAWLEALHANTPVVIIGPRSALFMPVRHLGLLVVDECHEPSYKQEQSPKYSALRVSTMLARFHIDAKAIFGSATPSVSDYFLAEKTSLASIVIINTPATRAQPPTIHLVDNKRRDEFREHRFLSDKLIAAIRKALERKDQILIFHNRRGTAPVVLCKQCGWTATCPNCKLPLTLHADSHQLRCHLCAHTESLMPACQECAYPDIILRGIGTKLIEGELRKQFPSANVARFDRDNALIETLQARYQELYDGEIDIVVGTQLLAKGLDLPHLTVVGILQAESGINLPDYQADERVFQLIHQVIGRAGRHQDQSTVVVQTYTPEHEAIQLAIARDFSAFYAQELNRRRQTNFPPFIYLLKLTCSYKSEANAVRAARGLADDIRRNYPTVQVLGPSPAFHERIGPLYRWQLIIKSSRREHLVRIAANLPPRWQADIDPASML